MPRRSVIARFRTSLAVGAAIALAAGLSACGPSDGGGTTTSASAAGVTTPEVTTPEAASPNEAASPSSNGVDPSGEGAAMEQRTPAPGTTGNVTVTDDSVIIGNPDAAMTLTVYFDLQCPHCLDLHGFMAEDTAKWAAGDQVAVEYVAVNYLGPRTTHNFSGRGANLLALVADVNPEAWPAVLDQLFLIKPAATTDTVTDAQLVAAAEAGGVTLSAEDIAALEDMAYEAWVAGATADAAAAGVNFIPQVWMDGAMLPGATSEEMAESARQAVEG